MSDTRPIFFIDIDNTLYSKSKNVHGLMCGLIDQYFEENLQLSKDDAYVLHSRYYKEYGLAIEGLVRYYKVDPLEYNRKVDDALLLDDVLSPDPKLRRLLDDIDKTKVRLWLFTNAYITHGRRVVRLLGVDDVFEGITYCDYGARPFLCKPSPAMFEKAEREAGAQSKDQCYFIDDSLLNCQHAQARGWHTVHFLEPGDSEPPSMTSEYRVSSLEELRTVFPQFFKAPAAPSNL
ncbi:hypothetical protein MMC10_005645 [Thelotrema lepadinum]|nr:hypothetical protein [Thelotrema lepadinum]